MKHSRTAGIARIVVLVGGCCAEMVRFIKALAADVVVWVDVLTELEKLNAAPGVIRIVLAPGQTLDTLFEGLPDDEAARQIRAHLKSRPGVDLNTGLAQSPFAGRRAAELLVATPEFKGVLNNIFSKILIKHNGTIEKVEIDLYSSGCGGTGGAAGGPIVAEIARYYRGHHRAVVQVRFNRAGPLSFEGLGDGIGPNGAANVVADLLHTLSDPRPLAEVRSLAFYELPMVGKDKVERDRCMATLVQALNSTEYRALRDVTAPNLAAHSELGSIDLVDPGWWVPLGTNHIRLNVAARFRRELLDVLETVPLRNVVERIEVETKTLATVADANIPQLTERLHQTNRAGLAGIIDAVERTSTQFSSIVVYAHYRASGRGAFEEGWRDRCKSSCRTVQEFRGRLGFLRALDLALDSEIRTRSDKIASLQNDRRQTRSTLSEVTGGYFPRTLGGKMANWLSAEKKGRDRDRRFGIFAKTAREIKLSVDTFEAEIKALGQCRDELRKEINGTEQRIRSVIVILGPAATLDRAAASPDLVEIADLDAVLQDLLQIADVPEIDEQLLADTLLGCAKRATLAGLAVITGAHEPRANLIARQLDKPPPTVAPFWGGKRPMAVDSTVFVLPPVSGDVRSQLTTAFAALALQSEKHQLVFADTAEAGFNVVQIQVRHPKTYGEIVTPQIADELEHIAAEPWRYLPRNFDVNRLKPFTNGHVPGVRVGS